MISSMKESTIFSKYLTYLGVPHTGFYSDGRFNQMPFKSLFGLSKLFSEYGIDTAGMRLADNSHISRLMPPFIAETSHGLELVTAIDGKKGVTVADSRQPRSSIDDFCNRMTGVVFCAYPSATSSEPGYRRHRLEMIGDRAKKWALGGSLLLLFLWFFITGGAAMHISTVLLTVFDLAGLYISYLLLLKQLNIESPAAEKVCGVIQKEGCSKVLSTDASSFFGLFHWAEVGAAYFAVSLIALLAFPSTWPMLALINICCVPYSFWSVWYQHSRAKAWCTLCLTVQALLWLQFFAYLAGGLTAEAWPLRPVLIPLAAAYVAALLLLNHFLPDAELATNPDALDE